MVLAAACACAQPSRIDAVLQQLEGVRSFSAVSISPDGRWIAWAQSSANDSGTELYLLDWKKSGAKPRRITADTATISDEPDPTWSPDSKQLAFVAETDSSQRQIFIASVSGGAARQLTHANGYLTDIRWSLSGAQIAFLYAEGGGSAGPLHPVPAQTGEVGSDIHNQRLAIISAAGGEIRQVSPGDLNLYEYDWSFDGRSVAAIAAPGPADNNWWIARLYVLDVASGKMKALYEPPIERQLALPRFSPDGKRIAFIGGLMSDQGFNGGDIFVVDSTGGVPRDITPDRKASPTSFEWRGNADIVFTEIVEGQSAISTMNVSDGRTETLWKGQESVHEYGNYPNFSLARDGRTSALIRSSWERAPEIWAGPIGDWQPITHANSEQRRQWGKAESIVCANEGFRVQGWLLYPENFDPAKTYPMVVEIHGGPSNWRRPSWPAAHFDMSVMAALGYFVFFPNARGSYGEGEAFTRANVKDFGGGDLRDILTGVDAVLKRVPVDAHRLGVTGWSYGGFMTMWTVTQTSRFRAAVAGAGIADWTSYYGENSIDEWMIPFFGTSVYDDPAVYAKSSPITFIKQVKTPTLVVVGERDGECPAPQSFEFWHALKTLGVPTQLVVYPGEGHSFHDLRNRLDVMKRAVSWFDHYLTE
ncbi:MAG: S9 family peptidase [Acidobacteriaceae bacterium]|nr:S9 family peptidase [Acidobacteriaceae bacterium]